MNRIKSFISVSLIIAFIGSIVGIQVYKHYCGNLLEDVSIYFQSNPCQDEGGEDACSKGKADSCCDDETEFYQLKIDLIKHTENNKIQNYFVLAQPIFGDPSLIIERNSEVKLFQARPPPDKKVPIYKRLLRFTYYG